MNKTKIREYLNEHIPITKALGVEPVQFNRNVVIFSAPLSSNINHRSTAFGGSISSILIITGWSYLRLIFDEEEKIPTIVISSSNTKFLKPITSDFTSHLILPDMADLNKFLEIYHRFGKSRITLQAIIGDEKEPMAHLTGDYVVLNK